MSDGWTLVYDAFDPDQEGRREALCTLGNGYVCTRGAAAEALADHVHYPGTYLAGGYDRRRTEIAGRVIENEDLVNLPNWLCLTFRIDGGSWFDLHAVEILAYRQALDLRTGTLTRRLRVRDADGRRTELVERRLVHMASPHLMALQTTLRPLDWTGRIEIRSGIDGRVVNDGVRRYRDLAKDHLDVVEHDVADGIAYLKTQTRQSELRIAQAARTRLYRAGSLVDAAGHPLWEDGFVGVVLAADAAESHALTVEKVAALYSSRDAAVAEPGLEARAAAARADGFDALLDEHARAWAGLWQRADVALTHEPADGDGLDVPTVVRLHIFHLLQTASPHSMGADVGVPARGLTGEAYRGHVFWDELFVFPFLNLRIAEITRSLLLYRYRRLDAARRAAREAGYAGAMFPWQSGSDGREESQRLHLNPKSGRWVPDNSRLQRHVNAAIAFNVWQYWQVSHDMDFLAYYGAEMLLEIARFWASIAEWSDTHERYEIRGVMGPDEYHDGYPDRDEPGLDNNTYTNVLAVWVLCRALELLDLLPEDVRDRLCRQLRLDDAERRRWDDVSRRMRIVFHPDGVPSQFEGYEDLAEFDWQGYETAYGDIQRLDRILEAEDDTPNRYKASKQADVLMLFYLFSADDLRALFERLGYRLAHETIPRTIDYYLHRTSHGSTLSRVVHSWVLARSDRERSWALFRQALASDVTDIQGGTTPEGVHLGAMIGSVDLLQRCYTGLAMRGDVLWFDPALPRDVALQMRLSYRGHTLDVDVSADRLAITALRCDAEPIRISVGDCVRPVAPGERMEILLADSSAHGTRARDEPPQR